MATLALALLATPALASKQVVDFFGGDGSIGGLFEEAPSGVAVNTTGAGAGNAGDLYTLDVRGQRIQRFGRDDNGTPADSADDTYFFISAWGADVDATPSGGSDYEVCTVAADCQPGVASGGNGAAAGNGTLAFSRFGRNGIAVDEDTGQVYVSDNGQGQDGNFRVNVYEGDGTFLRSFGWDVVASGPDQVTGDADEQQQLIVKATGGRFALSYEGRTTGATGTGVTVPGSKTITEVTTSDGAFEVGQGISAASNFGFPAGTTITAVGPDSLTASAPSGGGGEINLTGYDLPHNASAEQVETALNSLPTIGGAGASVTVSGGPGDLTGSSPYTIKFGGALGGRGAKQLIPATANLTISAGAPSATVATSVQGGGYEICKAGIDVCRAGSGGPGAGQVGGGSFSSSPGASGIAVSQPDGNPATGAVFLADTANSRVNTYGLDGSSPASIGSAVQFTLLDNPGPSGPTALAIDSRGILYASNGGSDAPSIQRYDTQNANGGGVGFLPPIYATVDERQFLLQNATAGQFRLSFGPDTTGNLAFDASAEAIRAALQALPSIGAGNVSVSPALTPSGKIESSITFTGALAHTDVAQLVASNGSAPLTGSIDIRTGHDGHAGALTSPVESLAVDPDGDGGGPEADVLYVGTSQVVRQFGPANAPGLNAPPAAGDDTHGNAPKVGGQSLAFEQATGRLYAGGYSLSNGLGAGRGVYVLDEITGSAPSGSLDSVSGLSAQSVTAHATIDPNGPPDTSYRFEYSDDGSKWISTPNVTLGHQEDPQAIEAAIEPPLGFEPNTLYHLRMAFGRKFVSPTITPELTFTTAAVKPVVETTGTPLRTTTTAQMLGRVSPRGSATTYHFEYGTQGPCDANPCTSTPDKAAGSGAGMVLVAEALEGLEPATTYHYRLIADNAAAGSAVVGIDRTVTTRSPDAPLSHGNFPGPPGSDRAYEQVSMPDSGGNPASGMNTSVDGNRALYSVTGGTPVSDFGNFLSLYYAERPPGAHPQSGWQTRPITPPRSETNAAGWGLVGGTADLSTVLANNGGFEVAVGGLWRLAPEGQPVELFHPVSGQTTFAGFTIQDARGMSTDGSRVATVLEGGTPDPSYPSSGAEPNVYDISSGTPQLLSLLPGDAVPACGVSAGLGAFASVSGPFQESNWIAPDGSNLIFPSKGNDCASPPQLYLREIVAGQTKRISPAPLSGPLCEAGMIKQTQGAVFFTSASRLAANDSEAASCGSGNDVYRYDLSAESVQCVTCVVPGLSVDISTSSSQTATVSDDGSRVYFATAKPLAPGAGAGIYRVTVGGGELAFVVPGSDNAIAGGQFNSDGSLFLFRSNDPALNPLGGMSNGGTVQPYLYDDSDRSLVCASCPRDGSAPSGEAGGTLGEDGTVVFSTPTPLLGADQNTPSSGNPSAGDDIYEWRADGRLLLVTDGLTRWPGHSFHPQVMGTTPSGRDLFFTAPAQYTPDALDTYQRVYDARIGGGIDFPPAPKPCPLEVCQGTPKGAPEEAAPGTGPFVGPGNVSPTPPPGRRCPKGRHKVRSKGKTRCLARQVKQHQHRSKPQQANPDRRAAR